jgi:hypothetical protein
MKFRLLWLLIHLLVGFPFIIKSRVDVKQLLDTKVLDTKRFVASQLDEDSLARLPPMDSAGPGKNLMNKRLAKTKASFTCDCSLAKKTTQFSGLLSGALTDLHKCQNGHKSSVAVPTKQETEVTDEIAAVKKQIDALQKTKTAENAEKAVPLTRQLEQLELKAAKGAAPKSEDGGQCSSEASKIKLSKPSLVTSIGRHKTFEILAFDKEGKRCTTGGDLFYWAKLSKKVPSCPKPGACHGFPQFNVDIRDVGKGVYQGTFRAFEPGDYWLHVTWLGKHVRGSPVGVQVREGMPAFAGQPAKKLASPQAVNRVCSPYSERAGTTGLYGGYWKTKSKWQGAQCNPEPISQARALKCLKDRKIFFTGDSLNRCVFWTFTSWLAGLKSKNDQAAAEDADLTGGDYGGSDPPQEPTGTAVSGGFLLMEPVTPGAHVLKMAEKQRSHFDGWDQFYLEHIPDYNTSLFYSSSWNSAFVMNYPQKQPRGYFDGALAKQVTPMLNWQTRAGLARFPGDEGGIPGARTDTGGWHTKEGVVNVDCMEELRRAMLSLADEGGHPDAIVLGMASHDMIANDIEAYRTNLERAFWRLRYTQNYTGKIVWVSVTPPVSEKQGESFEAYKYLQTITKTREYNSVAAAVVADFGGVVIDAFSIALSRPEQSYDGQHYVGTGKTTLDDVVYMNIRAAVVHELCAGTSTVLSTPASSL